MAFLELLKESEVGGILTVQNRQIYKSDSIYPRVNKIVLAGTTIQVTYTCSKRSDEIIMKRKRAIRIQITK